MTGTEKEEGIDNKEEQQTVLLVDDEDGILDLMDTLISMEGYKVLRARSGEEAMQKTENHPIDAVLTDYRMPGMDGVELLSKLRERFPDAPRILITGFADIDIAMDAINKGGAYRFLRKPWEPEELLNELKTALNHRKVVKDKDRLQRLLQNQKVGLEKRVAERTSELNNAVTELKQANETISSTYEQLLQSDKLTTLGLMAGTIAHDISNPLTVVLTRAKLILMANSELGETDREHIELILRNAKKIENLIRSITRFARKSKNIFGSIDIRDVLKETLVMMSKSLSTNRIEVMENYETEEPFVFGDVNQIEQVFMNLIQNAIQAMDSPGKLILNLSRINGYVRAIVEDTGSGIEEENLNTLFDAFYTTKEEGTGLGLNICRRIVDEHKGMIQVQSKVGVGTRFIVDLPVYRNAE